MNYRYPGTWAFETDQRSLFFGRDEDVRRFHTSVKAQALMVLFAKSGTGKSSLLNAGLIPLLDEEFYVPIKIRLRDKTVAPVESVKQVLADFFDETQFAKYAIKSSRNTDLWEYVRACVFSKGGTTATPVLIFDQFEEFFDHPLESRIALIKGLADLLNERLPKEVQDGLRKIPFRERTDADLAWYSPLKVKVVFSIRSDRLHLLDSISDEIPTILQNRYHLRSFGRAQAREAIIKPALIEGNFTAPIFDYNPKTLDNILDYLTNEKGEIEAFQLQLVCQYIEREVIQRLS